MIYQTDCAIYWTHCDLLDILSDLLCILLEVLDIPRNLLNTDQLGTKLQLRQICIFVIQVVE